EVLRVFTVALEIIAGWLTFLCLIRLRIPRLMAGTFTCLLIGLFSVNKFHGLARLDFLQLAVVLAALHQLLVFMESPPVMRPTTCLFRFTCFSVLALLAKPTSILFLFGVGIFALLQLRGDRRIVAWLIA